MVEVARIALLMRAQGVPAGMFLARLAARQHGVVARRQLLAIGFSDRWISRQLRDGRLIALHRGVYAVGHARLTRRGTWMAAVLACNESSLVSHRSAAAALGIAGLERGRVDVTVPGRGALRIPGLAIHRTRDLPPAHCTVRDGIPLTTPHRTLLDLAAICSPTQLRLAVEAADRLELLHVPSLIALCGTSPGRRGSGNLKRIAAEQRGPIVATRSPPERLFLRLCLNRGLPVPAVNVPLEGYEVDFLWLERRLVVEIDSYTYHRSWAQQQRDRTRDAHLQVRGYRVLRYTEARLIAAEDAVFAQIETLLAL